MTTKKLKLTFEKAAAVIFFDGGSRGNGTSNAVGGCGYIIKCEGITVDKGHRHLGNVTNNIAEYEGLKMAMEAALNHGFSQLVCKGDSNLVIQQMKGNWKINAPHLKTINETCKGLESKFDKVEYMHIRREYNKEADSLANRAMDASK